MLLADDDGDEQRRRIQFVNIFIYRYTFWLPISIIWNVDVNEIHRTMIVIALCNYIYENPEFLLKYSLVKWLEESNAITPPTSLQNRFE